MEDKKYDIFISYNRKDKELVEKTVNILQDEGYSVWIDKKDIPHTERFAEMISSAIRNCKLVIFFSSKNSNASKWTFREISLADEQEKSILPIRIDVSSYSDRFALVLAGINYLEITNENELIAKKNDLIDSVRKIIGSPDNESHCLTCQYNNEQKTSDPIKNVSSQTRTVNPARNSIDLQFIKYLLKSEAFLFTIICASVWAAIEGLVFLKCSLISNSYLILICTIVGIVATIFATHWSTESKNIPGWYNRNLTSYAAIIIASDGWILLAAFTIGYIFKFEYMNSSLPLLFATAIGIYGTILLYRCKYTGYILQWVASIILAVSSYLWWPANHQWEGCLITFMVMALLIIFLKYTLMLKRGGVSCWGIMNGKETRHNTKVVRFLETYLLGIWVKIFK